MTRGLSWRAATATDEPFLRQLFRSTREREWDALPLPDAQKDALLAMQFVARNRSYRDAFPHGESLVVLCAGDAVGHLYLAPGPDALHVVDIALVPAWRNRGIGTLLLQDTIARAARDAMAVRLQVARDNPARRLYVRLGFACEGDDGVYLRMIRRAGSG